MGLRIFIILLTFLSLVGSVYAVECWQWDGNETGCNEQTLCQWDSWGNYCYEVGCWSLSTQEECNNYSSALGCTWRSGFDGGAWGWCGEVECWNYNDQFSCEAANCTWKSDEAGNQWCEKAGCWEYQNSANCTAGGCDWEGFGFCKEDNCWDITTKESCLNESDNLNCKWDDMGTTDVSDDQCTEVGPWEFTTQQTCEAAGYNWSMSGGWCADTGCWDYENKTACQGAQGVNCKWEGWSECRFRGCGDFTDNTSCLNTSDSFDCKWDTFGHF
jgi:hypothetical protein